MSTEIHTPTGLRSSLANAAWVVEERVVWVAGDALRGAVEVVKWPFERLAWAIERWLVWPLQERAGGRLRVAGAALVVLAAAAAGVAGLLWAAPDRGGEASVAEAPAPKVAPAPTTPAPPKAKAPSGPVLHGATPVFAPQTGDGSAAAGKVGEISQARAPGRGNAATDKISSNPSSPPAARSAGAAALPRQPAGPAALAVAHRFADAFVLYETGDGDPRIRAAFKETATPQLANTLLRRPPRLPANVKVPRAKVLNVVAGPSQGGIYPVSVSLLRVGLTSELRLSMEKNKDNWRVIEVLG